MANTPDVQQIYTNTPLDFTGSSFRILTLHSGKPDEPVQCSLSVASLDDPPAYDALSYVWGDPSDTAQVMVDGTPLTVPRNLKEFLEDLRSATWKRLLWADSICIQQSDSKEKSHQVELMAKIYSKTKQARIWFGRLTDCWKSEIDISGYVPPSSLDLEEQQELARTLIRSLDASHNLGDKLTPIGSWSGTIAELKEELLPQAIVVLRKLKANSHLRCVPLYLRTGSQTSRVTVNFDCFKIIDCIMWIFTRPWWKRVWTLQEAVLPSSDPLVHVGKLNIPLSVLTQGMENYIAHSTSCCRYFPLQAGTMGPNTGLSLLDTTIAMPLVGAILMGAMRKLTAAGMQFRLPRCEAL